MAACESGEKATRNLLDFFHLQTAKAGRRMCDGRDVEFLKQWRKERVRFYEADGTGLARYFVSAKNVAWKQRLDAWERDHKDQSKPSYFQAWV